MNEKKLDQIVSELTAIKTLLIVLLQSQEVKVGTIAKALGVTTGRVSQLAPTRKNKKRKGSTNG
jgi:predicted transcriptional regulator